MPVYRQALVLLPAANGRYMAVYVGGDLLPRLQPCIRAIRVTTWYCGHWVFLHPFRSNHTGSKLVRATPISAQATLLHFASLCALLTRRFQNNFSQMKPRLTVAGILRRLFGAK